MILLIVRLHFLRLKKNLRIQILRLISINQSLFVPIQFKSPNLSHPNFTSRTCRFHVSIFIPFFFFPFSFLTFSLFILPLIFSVLLGSFSFSFFYFPLFSRVFNIISPSFSSFKGNSRLKKAENKSENE